MALRRRSRRAIAPYRPLLQRCLRRKQAHAGCCDPAPFLLQAPTWLKAAMVMFAAGGLGVFSGFGNNKDPDTY